MGDNRIEINHNRVQELVLAGILVSVGVLLPFVTSHAFGVPGTILLPMHIPVFLMGFLCGPKYGAAGGLLTPAISAITTGMPPVFPMLPIMAGELFTYGFIGGILYHKLKLPLMASLLISMACGRMVYGIIFAILLTTNGATIKALSVTNAFIQGIPGIIIQLLFIPAIVIAYSRYRGTYRI